jgi:hypothetical protein
MRRWARRAAGACVVALLLVVGGSVTATTVDRGVPVHPITSAPAHRSTGLAAFTTALGPDGPQASWVVAENARRGTTAWQITGSQLANVSPQTTGIAGYADQVEVTAGQQLRLYVSTAAPAYTVTAYRMGYYGGAGGRAVWASGSLPGVQQPACPVAAGINMVACAWPVSTTVAITSAWVQGQYLLKLVGSGGQQSYIPLTVWDPASTAAYVIMDGSLTDQVFNPYGGYDLYQGATPCAAGIYPCSSRARVVSFDRPYAGRGDGGYLGLTYPLTRLAEEHGLDVTYWTDLTLAQHGALLTRHRVLLSPGHDEEWSLSMRQATVAAITHGVNVGFFGASPVLRKVRLQPSPLGADRQVVNYRDAAADPDYGDDGDDDAQVSQNDWTQPPARLAPSLLVGASYIGFNNGAPVPLVVTDPASWLYAGTGLTDGAQVPGMLRTDFQEYLPGEPGPSDVEIQAHSPVTVQGRGSAYADTSYYTVRSGAGVWQSGTNSWIAAIGSCVLARPCPSSLVQTMTLNVLRVLGSGPLGRDHPSRENWMALPRSRDAPGVATLAPGTDPASPGRLPAG